MPTLVDAIAMVHVTTARAIYWVGATIVIFLRRSTFSLDPTLALVTKKILVQQIAFMCLTVFFARARIETKVFLMIDVMMVIVVMMHMVIIVVMIVPMLAFAVAGFKLRHAKVGLL